MRQIAVDLQVARAEQSMPRRYRPARVIDQIRHPIPAGPVIFGTDGSVDHNHHFGHGVGWVTGWGFLATDGRYGCGKIPQFTPKAGPDMAQIAELRAVWHAIGSEVLAGGPVIVLTDSENAVATLTAWQAGSTKMPAGYTGSTGKRVPTLERLRRAVAKHPDHLTVQHVHGHRGDLLNEAADALARLATRWAREDLLRDQVAQRAANIAEGFLASWRGGRP